MQESFIRKFVLFFLLTTLVSCSHVSNVQRVPAQSEESSIVKDEFPENVQKFLEWEFHANSANKPDERLSQFFRVEHFEIPTHLIDNDISDQLDTKIKKSLIFFKDGVEYIRWVINPEDTHYKNELKNFLDSKGIDSTLKSLFAGGLTSSRSMIISDKGTGAIFSIKVGTNKTGGNWQNKGVNGKQVVKARIATTISEKVDEKFNLQNLKVQPETMGGTIKELNHGYIVRELGDDFVSGKKHYLPGFSALNETVGKEIAKINGSDDPAYFWAKHYHEQLGKASAEMFSFFGMSYSSAHSQQYIIELDENFKPTGKIFFRDIADSSAFRNFFLQHDIKNLESIWMDHHLKDVPWIASGTLDGMTPPSWLKESDYMYMNESFVESFEKKLSVLTRVPKSKLSMGKSSMTMFGYFYKNYHDKRKAFSRAWENYIELAPCFQGREVSKYGKDCKDALSYMPKTYNRFYKRKPITVPKKKGCFSLLKKLISPQK